LPKESQGEGGREGVRERGREARTKRWKEMIEMLLMLLED
jgi:hypothetical protein